MSVIFQKMKRILTNKEIEQLLDFIKPREGIPPDSAASIVEMTKNRYRKQLKNQMVYPAIIPQLKQGLMASYRDSLIAPGESVGVISAQSIGERNTQTTLSSFHKAGMSNITTTAGVPRFLELLNATKNPRIVNHEIYYTENNTSIPELREQVGSHLIGLNLGDLSEEVEIFLEKQQEKWCTTHGKMYGQALFEMTAGIRFKLKRDKLYEYKLGIPEITEIIYEKYDDLFCVFSPPNLAILDVYLDTEKITLPETLSHFISEEDTIKVYLEECARPILEKMNICGIPGVLEHFYTKGTDDEWFVETNAKILKTNKTNTQNKQTSTFKKILALPGVDATRTLSNNIWDIYETLDIEAANEYLLYSFMLIMDGINSCHAKILVDKMTFGGTISSITRFTLKKEESGPMGKASFEESLDNFLNSAACGDIERTTGVSASIICGKLANIGTGMFKTGLDFDMLPEEPEEQEEEQEEEEQEERWVKPEEPVKEKKVSKKVTKKVTIQEPEEIQEEKPRKKSVSRLKKKNN